MASFVTVALPGASLVFTNNIYVNPDCSFIREGVQRVRVNGEKVYNVSQHPGVNPGEVALNALQRTACKLTQGQTIHLEPFNETLPEAHLLKIDVKNMQRKPCTISEDEIVKTLHTMFNGQLMSEGLLMAIETVPTAERKSDVLQVAVERILIPDTYSAGGIDFRAADFAVLGPDTEFEIVSRPAPNLTIIQSTGSKQRAPLLNPNWKFEDMGIGGLDAEFASIFRRAFASRLFPPKDIERLGIKHVKGLLLYGPPGTGKTLIARQIGKMLGGKEPKVVNGPEILNKFVGQAEENIRNLFADAEKDWEENKENSALHIIIFDEIDAICKTRGSVRSGTGVHDTVVNQLLTKLDGVNTPNNFLVIGMTNRKDMLDPALLRPGRLEVHVEISLPDKAGRVQILKIHTKKMRENGFLDPDVDLEELAERTKNFSGAELEGLVKDATSYALYGSIDVTKVNVSAKRDLSNLKVTMHDFLAALEESKPSFGVAEEDVKALCPMDPIHYGEPFSQIVDSVTSLINNLRESTRTDTTTVLFEGVLGSGKTALAAHFALQSEFPFVKLIAPEDYIGMAENEKATSIANIFEQAYKTPLSVIIIDGVERLLEFTPIGPRFSNVVLNSLQILLRQPHPKPGRKLLVIATTSNGRALKMLELESCFDAVVPIPALTDQSHVRRVVNEIVRPKTTSEATEIERVIERIPLPFAIKPLIKLLDMATQGGAPLTVESFDRAFFAFGFTRRNSSDSDDE